MPNITNLNLRILNTDSEEWKTVRVSYTVNFTSLEVSAAVIFQADSWLYSYDGNLDQDRNVNVRYNQPVERNYITASNEPVSMIDSTIIRKRNLDEGPDFKTGGKPFHPVIIIKNTNDEWFARVTLSPLTFQNSVADSPVLRGSWGAGSDL